MCPAAKTDALDYIIEKLLKGEEIRKIKLEAAKLYSLERMPRNSDIIRRMKEKGLENRIKLFKRPMRTLSGVTPIAVMIKPEQSCNWRCVYCPFTGRAAKSYTGEEPAALRARDNDFDAYKQVISRIGQFEAGGHETEKCEVIVMGGTFLAMDKAYKHGFIKGIYDACNGTPSESISHAKSINEKSKHRVIGLTIETRPDVCTEKHIDEILEFGATRIELGVQNPDDEIYKATKRGHGTEAVLKATKQLKDSSFKVLYHIMPGLPGSSSEKDIKMSKKLFEDERFRPDMLKIYPTLVIPGTELYESMKRGEYSPYSAEEAADIISEFYRYIPKYVRVMRIQRDIPATNIAEGVKKSNLRELVERKFREKGIIPKEIRYREVGLANVDFNSDDFELKRLDYNASSGKEVFLSFENKDDSLIAGFLRLRMPQESHRQEIDGKTALIRELHIYGRELALDKKGKAAQHHGLGSELLSEAERIAKEEFNRNKMIVISGVGVREYYYNKGYRLLGPYVAKKL
jgi:elongator complex protein 3